MTRADAVLSAVAVIAGSSLGVYPWLLTGGFESSSVDAIWVWNWIAASVTLLVALVAAGRPDSLTTAVVYAYLSLFAFGLGITWFQSSMFGPSIDDGSATAQLVASMVAALVARYAGTRHGPLPGPGRLLVAALAGAALGLGLAVATVGGWATVLSHVIPCSGFECGVGTGLFVYMGLLFIGLAGGMGLGVQLARRRADVPGDG